MKSSTINKIVPGPEAHIKIKKDMDPEIFALLMQICPAGLYWKDEKGMHYDYTGCLECGTCRIIAGDDSFEIWTYPANGKGVDYGGD